MRVLYRLLLLLHPRDFNCEYGAELLWIFDEEASRGVGELRLVLDAVVSLARQWVIRRAAWKWAVGMMIATLQVLQALVFVFGKHPVH